MANFTPTGSSWLNQVEIWFGIITNKPSGEGPSHHCATHQHHQYLHHELESRLETIAADDHCQVRLLHQDFKKLLANNAQ
jgi:hypothetical protein